MILAIIAMKANAQNSHFNSDEFWNRCSLVIDRDVEITANDTVAIIASNRVFNDTALRFLPDECGRRVNYFVVYSNDGKWKVFRTRDLATAINYIPEKNKDWVIYTEGMGKLFTSATDRAMRMNAQYGVNVIMLDYPSIKAKWRRTRNYYFSKHHASIAYKDFAPVFDTIKTLKQQKLLGHKSLNLFFHSMGNIVLEKLVKNNRISFLNKDIWVDNLILNAPCVPQRKHREWLDKINFAKQIYVHYNPNDFTLGGAYFMSKWNQLGMKVKRPISKKATYINFETLVGRRHSNFLNLHNYPPQPKAAIKLYDQLFHGMSLDTSDTTMFRPSIYRKIGWDILSDSNN